MNLLRPPTQKTAASERRPARMGLVLVPLVFLMACASAPLPPWNPFPAPAQTRPATDPARPALPAVVVPRSVAPAPAAAPALASPIPLASPPAAATPPPLAEAPPPYGPSVSRRFPDPAVVYKTPGLQATRTSFTSNAEIQAWMREQVRQTARSDTVNAELLPLGMSQRGEAIEALLLTRAAGTDAASVLATGRPTVLLVGQQHGDEPAGSEALLVLARELTQGSLQSLLERINVIVVARANPDGSSTASRATSGGLDMNRDHLLLNTPEAQALARLARDFQPTVVVDVHEYTVVGRYLEKFGTVQKFDALLQYASTANLPEFLTKAAEEWYRRPVLNALKNEGLSSEWYYTTSTDLADKTISMGGTQPDTARNVHGLKNMVSLLIETRGVGLGRLHIQRRVHTHVVALTSVLNSTAQRASELMQLKPYLDRELTAQACRDEVVIESAPTPAQYDLVMLDPLTGADKIMTVDWNSALALRKIKARVRPCGYWLSANAAGVVDRLRLHGVQVMRVAEPGSMLGDLYRENARSLGARQDVRGSIADSRDIIKAEVALVRGVIDAPRGSYYVPLNQPLANLVVAALEPDTQSSYFANRILESLQSVARVMAEPTVRFDDLQ